MKRLHLLLSAMLVFAILKADNSITEYDKQFFIDTYASLAVEEMGFSGIPASITLAQAILESGWGRGTVAEGANNYFCIKCNNGWEGETFDAKDDEPGLSCFRKYQTVFESFRDHSLFLKHGQRYQSLFNLEKNDFRGWAQGLKECGYATDATYSDKLIDLVEEHGLWIFDFAISTQQFATIDTPEIPKESKMVEARLKEEINNETPAFPFSPTQEIEAPVLAVPMFKYQPQDTQKEKPENLEVGPHKSEFVRAMKIRPIVPHPVSYLQRAD